MSAHTVFYKKLHSKNFFYYSFCIFCITVVAVNIVYSQRYNKNMIGVMEGEQSSVISYLKHISGTQLYHLEIQTYREEGRDEVLSAWNDYRQANAIKIRNLEANVKVHPYSPELYYNLYLLYSQEGDGVRAKDNLKKAQQIDPSIGT